MRFVIYYSKIQGGFRCDVWGDKGTEMYPELWNNKFIGYDKREIRKLIRDKLSKRYNRKVVIARTEEF